MPELEQSAVLLPMLHLQMQRGSESQKFVAKADGVVLSSRSNIVIVIVGFMPNCLAIVVVLVLPDDSCGVCGPNWEQSFQKKPTGS